MSLEQSQLEDETVIRAGLGVMTPPAVTHLELEEDSFVSLPALSPEPQTLQHVDEKALMEAETQDHKNLVEDEEEEEEAKLELSFVIETFSGVAEEPVDVQAEKGSQPMEQASGPPAERPVLVPPPRPAVIAPPKLRLVPPPRPPPPPPDDQPVEVHHTSTIDPGRDEDSDKEDDEGEVEMDLVFSTALVTDESEESPEPDVTVAGEPVVSSNQREPLQTSGMAYIDEMVKDLASDSNSSSSGEDNDDGASQSEDEEDEVRHPSDDATDRDTDVDALMAKAALLLGDDSDDSTSPSPKGGEIQEEAVTSKKKLQNQHGNKKAKKSGRKKRKEVPRLSTVKEEPEAQHGSGGEHQNVIIVKLEAGTMGLGLSVVDGNVSQLHRLST